MIRRLSLPAHCAFLAAIAALPLLALSPASALEAPRAVPQSRTEALLSFSPVVKRAQPAVVNVYASRAAQKQARNPLFDDPVFRQFFGEDSGGHPGGQSAQSLGSGVIVDATGLVITNHHVIEGMTEVKVALSDKREFEAEIVLRDPRTDLAVLRLKGGKDFPVLELGDSDQLEVGDLVLALGNPFGVGQTVTQGIVSALARTQVGVSDYGFFIQTDAAINPGNSGGALVDLNARLIGVNSMIFSKSGGSVGIGFAIPVNMVKIVIGAARGGVKQVHRPWLGATLQGVSKEIADSLGLERASGALVAAVQDKSPAAEAGLKRSDIITGIDGRGVDDAESLGYRLGTKPLGGAASLSVLRGGKALTLPVKLIAAPETPSRDLAKIKGRSPFTGVTVVNVSPAVNEEYSLDSLSEGVVVVEVDTNSIAESVGMQKNDIVVEINDTKITTTQDLVKVSSGKSAYWRLIIKRGGELIRTVIGG